MEKIVFIDRDGVINVDLMGDYIKTWDEFRFEKGVLEGLKTLAGKGYGIILISNQAGIGDGVFSEKALWDVHKKMLEVFAANGIKIRSTHFCLHGKKAGCKCRKPATGLFEEAVRGLDYERGRTFFIGDKQSDILAGKNFGLRTILVRTGYGAQDEPACIGPLQPDYVVNTLKEAAEVLD